KPVDGATVQLRSSGTGAPVATVYTNRTGQFEFTSVSAGDYLVVAEAGIATASQQISAAEADPAVALVLPRDPSADAGGRDSVSVAQFQVPDKARKLFRKAQEATDKRKLDDARKYLAEALDICPRYAAALTLRGILQLDAHDYEAATHDMEQ